VRYWSQEETYGKLSQTERIVKAMSGSGHRNINIKIFRAKD
jgi:hypothetical protein